MKTPKGRHEVEQLFGNPANNAGNIDLAWEQANIRLVAPPPGWHLFYQADTTIVPTSGIRLHRLLEDTFREVLTDVWNFARSEVKKAEGYDKTTEHYDEATRAWLHKRRLDLHGGGYNFRKVTGGNGLSMHAYGIAIDWDPKRNPRKKNGPVSLPDWWYDIWHQHGWNDGRHFPTSDPMHVQFATGV